MFFCHISAKQTPTPAPMFDDVGENRAAEQGEIVAQSGRGGGEVLRTWRGAPTKGEKQSRQTRDDNRGGF